MNPRELIKDDNIINFVRFINNTTNENLDRDFIINSDKDAQCSYTLLTTLIVNNKKDMIYVLLKSEKVDVNKKITGLGHSRTPLDIAVLQYILKKINIDILKILLDYNAKGTIIIKSLWENLDNNVRNLFLEYYSEDDIFQWR